MTLKSEPQRGPLFSKPIQKQSPPNYLLRFLLSIAPAPAETKPSSTGAILGGAIRAGFNGHPDLIPAVNLLMQ